jgi:hypothetical protein
MKFTSVSAILNLSSTFMTPTVSSKEKMIGEPWFAGLTLKTLVDFIVLVYVHCTSIAVFVLVYVHCTICAVLCDVVKCMCGFLVE